jgi:hypothetical protein
VWWAALSKSQNSLEVTIQKMTGIDPATYRDLLASAKVQQTTTHTTYTRSLAYLRNA